MRMASDLRLVYMVPKNSIQWQARVQEFVRGVRGAQNLKGFFFIYFISMYSWVPAQKIDEKMIFSTKKVAKYRWNSLKFALMTFFLAFQFLGGGAGPLPPLGHAPEWTLSNFKWSTSQSIVSAHAYFYSTLLFLILTYLVFKIFKKCTFILFLVQWLT